MRRQLHMSAPASFVRAPSRTSYESELAQQNALALHHETA